MLAASPNARFDVEVNLKPTGKKAFTDVNALVAFMNDIDNQLHVDGWWFDFFSTAWSDKPEWVTAAIQLAHSKNQTVGGNVWGGTVPTGADAVSFVDWPNQGSPYGNGVDQTQFGFGIAPEEVKRLKASAGTAAVLGHLNCNPQNGPGTLSCVYIDQWNTTTRAQYLDYWLDQAQSLGFTYFWNVFFPLCPGATSFNPLDDEFADAGHNYLVNSSQPVVSTFYDFIADKATGSNSSSPAGSSGSNSSSSGSSGSSQAGGQKSAAYRKVPPVSSFAITTTAFATSIATQWTGWHSW